MKLLNRVKCENIINVVILMKLLKGHYTFFFIVIYVSRHSHLYGYLCFQTVPKYTLILII